MEPIIRLATNEDAPQILAIYRPIVEQTIISFELEPPTIEEMQRRIVQLEARFPWLICERQGEILGYAYATSHRVRAAYQWSVDVSVYVHPQARRRGVGQALYTSLFKALVLQGFYNAYAGIALPNPASVGLHESLGFSLIGVFSKAGYKLGAWHDIGWWHLALQRHASLPPPPVELDVVRASDMWQAVLKVGLPYMRM